MLVVVGFCLAGYIAGRLTAASRTALALGAVLIAVLVTAPFVVGQPWLVLVAMVSIVPGYARGSRRLARAELGGADSGSHHPRTGRIATNLRPRVIDLRRSSQIATAVPRPAQQAQQQPQG